LIDISDKFKIEKLHLKFCKFITQVPQRTSNLAIRSELGSFPISHIIIKKILKYWLRLKTYNVESILSDSFACSSELLDLNIKDNFMSVVSNILHITGYSFLLHNNNFKFVEKCINKILKLITDMYISQWRIRISSVHGSSSSENNKLRTYQLFKTNFNLENYLICLKQNSRKLMCKLRVGILDLMIEIGRYHKPHKIPLSERVCNFCKDNQIEDEFHFLMSCSKFLEIRTNFFHSIEEINFDFKNYTLDMKFTFLLSCQDTEVISKLSSFLDLIYDIRSHT